MSSHSVGVALIEPVGSHGGMDYYDCGLAAGLVRNGVRCVWYSCDKSRVRGEGDIELVRSFSRIWGKDSALLRAFRYVRGLIVSVADARRRELQIAHYHFFHVGPLELAGILMARMAGLRVVVTVHDVESFKRDGKSRAMSRFAYSFCARLIVHNAVSERELRALVGSTSDRIRVVPHGSYVGLVPAILDRAEARRRLGLDEDARVVLFFGQIKTVKGLDLLIRAFSRIHAGVAPCVLLIAGKIWKDDFSEYQRLIDQSVARESIVLHIRYIDDDEVPMFYGSADLVVMPYRKIYQSGVLLMAMTLGVPVVTSDLPGMTEIVRDGENGYLFRTEQVDHLSEVLEQALAAGDDRERMTANARRQMETEYSWSSIGRRLKEVYLQALGQHRPVSSAKGESQ